MAKPLARIAGDLLDEHGTTYAQQASIDLADRPAPLFQLLVLANLLAARIGADIAVAAARELWDAGLTTPRTCAPRRTASASPRRLPPLRREHCHPPGPHVRAAARGLRR
ncbi:MULTISPECIES: hypothetical protein [Micrococcales]|uniref:Uncharacterized protein n=1 Tax=Brevibacterium antiquum TaxID=234835 RepID=A0A2H1IU92_9MICO|nr:MULTISPECIES: hypothetical protein [Micrococcales]SMX78773.1 hypothetical protein BANT10_01290 [Brevibacterium antiquum]